MKYDHFLITWFIIGTPLTASQSELCSKKAFPERRQQKKRVTGIE